MKTEDSSMSIFDLFTKRMNENYGVNANATDKTIGVDDARKVMAGFNRVTRVFVGDDITISCGLALEGDGEQFDFRYLIIDQE